MNKENWGLMEAHWQISESLLKEEDQYLPLVGFGFGSQKDKPDASLEWHQSDKKTNTGLDHNQTPAFHPAESSRVHPGYVVSRICHFALQQRDHNSLYCQCPLWPHVARYIWWHLICYPATRASTGGHVRKTNMEHCLMEQQKLWKLTVTVLAAICISVTGKGWNKHKVAGRKYKKGHR